MRSSTRKALLVCGIVSSLLYAGANVAGALRWEGYSLLAHTVSELSAIGAPSRPLVVAFLLASALFGIAFGVGVRESARGNRPLRIAGDLLVAFGLVCLTGPLTPMHRRETLAAGGATLTDTLHIAGATVDVVFIVAFIGFGAAASGKRFRFYSIATIAVVLGFGALAGLQGPRVDANLPTPWIGLLERICILGYLLWVAALAIALLRLEKSGEGTARTNMPKGALSRSPVPSRG